MRIPAIRAENSRDGAKSENIPISGWRGVAPCRLRFSPHVPRTPGTARHSAETSGAGGLESLNSELSAGFQLSDPCRSSRLVLKSKE